MGEKRGFKQRLMNLFTCFASSSVRRLSRRRASSVRRPESNKIKPDSSLPAASPRCTPMISPYRKNVSHSAPLPCTSRSYHRRMGTQEREESLKDVIEYCKIAQMPINE